MEHLDEIHATLDGLRGLGVRLALDDFGTGYSSLSQLQDLPVDVLKIDRAFITGLRRADESSLARTIVELGQMLRIETVAEGIERPEQHAALRELGCDLAQGFLFAGPLDPEACERLFDRGVARPPTEPLVDSDRAVAVPTTSRHS